MNKEEVKEDIIGALNEWGDIQLGKKSIEDKLIFIFEELFIPFFKEFKAEELEHTILVRNSAEELLNKLNAVVEALDDAKQYYINRIEEL